MWGKHFKHSNPPACSVFQSFPRQRVTVWMLCCQRSLNQKILACIVCAASYLNRLFNWRFTIKALKCFKQGRGFYFVIWTRSSLNATFCFFLIFSLIVFFRGSGVLMVKDVDLGLEGLRFKSTKCTEVHRAWHCPHLLLPGHLKLPPAYLILHFLNIKVTC